MNDKQQDESIENLQLAIKELGLIVDTHCKRLDELEKTQIQDDTLLHYDMAKVESRLKELEHHVEDVIFNNNLSWSNKPHNSSDDYEEIDCDTDCCAPYEGYSGTHVKKSFDLGLKKGKLAGLKEALEMHVKHQWHVKCSECVMFTIKIAELERNLK